MTKAKEIEKIMNALKCSYDEAVEVWNDDNDITDSNVNDDLTAEQRKNIKKMTNAKEHKKSTAYDFKKRERKQDAEKLDIIAQIFEFLAQNEQFSVNIDKPESEIGLKIGENDYTVRLIRHRKAKTE